jgi:type I restriction enzyme, S subunit
MSDFSPLSAIATNVTSKVTSATKDINLPYVGLEHLKTDVPWILEFAPASSSISVNTAFQSGDTLFGKLRPNLRKVALADVEGYCSTDILVVRPRHGVDPHFLSHILRSAQVLNYAAGTAFGTKMPRTSWSLIERVEVLSPPLAEQRRIAEILDAIDHQIRAAERVIAKLRLAGEGLLSDLLAGRTFEEHGGDSEDLSSYSAPTPFENIPKGWAVAQCRELCREITVGIVIRPSQYYREAGIPMLRSANVRSGQIVLDDLKFMSSADHGRMTKTSVKPGDLVTVRTGYPGTTAVIPKELPDANCIDIIVSRPGPRVVPEYLALWINSEFGKGQVLKVQGGLAQQHFNVSEMNSLRVALPPRPEQLKIVEVWAEHEARTNAEIKVVEKLRLLKKGLEADLLTSRVRALVEVAS